MIKQSIKKIISCIYLARNATGVHGSIQMHHANISSGLSQDPVQESIFIPQVNPIHASPRFEYILKDLEKGREKYSTENAQSDSPVERESIIMDERDIMKEEDRVEEMSQLDDNVNPEEIYTTDADGTIREKPRRSPRSIQPSEIELKESIKDFIKSRESIGNYEKSLYSTMRAISASLEEEMNKIGSFISYIRSVLYTDNYELALNKKSLGDISSSYIEKIKENILIRVYMPYVAMDIGQRRAYRENLSEIENGNTKYMNDLHDKDTIMKNMDAIDSLVEKEVVYRVNKLIDLIKWYKKDPATLRNSNNYALGYSGGEQHVINLYRQYAEMVNTRKANAMRMIRNEEEDVGFLMKSYYKTVGKSTEDLLNSITSIYSNYLKSIEDEIIEVDVSNIKRLPPSIVETSKTWLNRKINKYLNYIKTIMLVDSQEYGYIENYLLKKHNLEDGIGSPDFYVNGNSAVYSLEKLSLIRNHLSDGNNLVRVKMFSDIENEDAFHPNTKPMPAVQPPTTTRRPRPTAVRKVYPTAPSSQLEETSHIERTKNRIREKFFRMAGEIESLSNGEEIRKKIEKGIHYIGKIISTQDKYTDLLEELNISSEIVPSSIYDIILRRIKEQEEKEKQEEEKQKNRKKELLSINEKMKKEISTLKNDLKDLESKKNESEMDMKRKINEYEDIEVDTKAQEKVYDANKVKIERITATINQKKERKKDLNRKIHEIQMIIKGQENGELGYGKTERLRLEELERQNKELLVKQEQAEIMLKNDIKTSTRNDVLKKHMEKISTLNRLLEKVERLLVAISNKDEEYKKTAISVLNSSAVDKKEDEQFNADVAKIVNEMCSSAGSSTNTLPSEIKAIEKTVKRNFHDKKTLEALEKEINECKEKTKGIYFVIKTKNILFPDIEQLYLEKNKEISDLIKEKNRQIEELYKKEDGLRMLVLSYENITSEYLKKVKRTYKSVYDDFINADLDTAPIQEAIQEAHHLLKDQKNQIYVFLDGIKDRIERGLKATLEAKKNETALVEKSSSCKISN